MESIELKSFQTLFDKIRSGAKFTAVFECGGDETLISFDLDGRYVEWDCYVSTELCERFIHSYDLPNAGEYFVDGTGTFAVDGDNLLMTYELKGHGYGWDPETNKELVIEEEVSTGTDVVYTL